MSPPQTRVDPKLVAAWVAGWARSRGTPPPVPAYGGLRVDVGLPDQTSRYVFSGLGQGLQTASREIRAPHVFLKACAAPEDLAAILDDGWIVQPAGFLMIAKDLAGRRSPLPPGYRCEPESAPGGFIARVMTPDDDVAASGRAFVVDEVAVFDQIVTHPDHRRRGLGGAVMAELGVLCASGGATTGVLVATSDGRALYATIGWRLESLYATAVRG